MEFVCYYKSAITISVCYARMVLRLRQVPCGVITTILHLYRTESRIQKKQLVQSSVCFFYFIIIFLLNTTTNCKIVSFFYVSMHLH